MIVKRYQGQIVKRMRRVSGGILLTFLSIAPGLRGCQIVVTQRQWQQHGRESFEPGATLAKLHDESSER